MRRERERSGRAPIFRGGQENCANHERANRISRNSSALIVPGAGIRYRPCKQRFNRDHRRLINLIEMCPGDGAVGEINNARG